MKRRTLLGLALGALASSCVAAARSEPTPAPTTAPANAPATATVMAEAFVRAIYAGDDAAARRLYPFHAAGRYTTERAATLERLSVRALSLAEANDPNPASQYQWAEVTTTVSYRGRAGKGVYVIGVLPINGRLEINAILPRIAWE